MRRQAWVNGLSAYLALTATEFEISGVLSEPSLAAALNGNGSWQAQPCSRLGLLGHRLQLVTECAFQRFQASVLHCARVMLQLH